MLTRARAAVLVLAGLTLAACGSIHPGAAAVVDGRSISMKTVDEVAEVYCVDALRAAKEQGAAAPADNAEIRSQAVKNMASLLVARKLAKREDAIPEPSTYEVRAADKDEVAKAFPGIDVEVATRAIEDSRELTQIAVGLGEKASGQKVTEANQDQLSEAGQTEIAEAFADNDVKFAPRFGLDGTLKQVTSTLSVAPTNLGEDKPNELPAAQRCS